jgi:hypothetical protein
MPTRSYHTPPTSTRARCPVCHEAVYSRAGIHPQCAVKQADPPRPKGTPPAPPVPPEPAKDVPATPGPAALSPRRTA